MTTTKGKIDCTPEEQGFDSGRIEALNTHFERKIAEGKIAGASYVITRNGKTIASAGVGNATYIDGVGAMRTDTIHRIASETKTFCAVAIFKLIEDGFFRLDTPVGEILPQMNRDPYKKITIAHLLTHTSGLVPDGGTFPDEYVKDAFDWIDMADKRFRAGEKNIDWLEESLHCGLYKPVGAEWMYCSYGFIILGEVISKVSGMNVHDFIVEKICRPLGMTSTFFDMDDEYGKRFNFDGFGHHGTAPTLEEIRKEKEEDKNSLWSRIPKTGGGLYSCPEDLVKFGNMLLGKGSLGGTRILGRKTVEVMTSRVLYNVADNCWEAENPDRRYSYGFDMRVGPGTNQTFHYTPGTFMHEGAGACSLVIDPVENMCASWFVPFAKEGWFSDCLWSVSNVIWSGLK